MFIDLVVVCQKANIDIEKLEKDLIFLNLLDFAKLCFTFCERWFEIKMPFSTTITEEFYISETNRILDNGVFGNTGHDNYVLARITEEGRKESVIHRYFPSAKILKNDPDYSYLASLPFLLPFAWVCRYIKQLKRKGLKGELRIISKFFASKEELDIRNNFLSQWKV